MGSAQARFTESRGCAGLVSGIRQQLILQMDVAAGVLSERQKRDYQGARGKRQYVYADEAAQYWLVSNARLLQKTILASIRSGMVRNKELYRQGRLSSGWGCTLQFWRNGAQIGAIHIRAEQERIYLHSPRRSTNRPLPRQ
jgi:hypothetical protein